MLIKELHDTDKPREKLLSSSHTLTDSELLAILIQQGYKDMSCIGLAQEILAKYDNSLNKLAHASLEELCEIKGIGSAKASIIKAIFLLAGRIEREELKIIDLSNPEKTASYLRAKFQKISSQEEILCVSLDTKNQLINVYSISLGAVDRTMIYPREVFRSAIHANAKSVILAHNHPTGDITPSKADIRITEQIVAAGEIVQIDVLDHIIISGKINSKESFYSIREKNANLFK